MAFDIRAHEKKKPVPAFEVGYKQNRITIIDYKGWLNAYPKSKESISPGKKLSRGQHFYRIECDCGNINIVTQVSIFGGKRECDKCAKKHKYKKAKEVYSEPKTIIPPELDFARIRLAGQK